MPTRELNRNLKRWPGWVVLLGVVVVALLIGANRSTGPLTNDDRADSITKRIACPVCDGESVYESQSPAAAHIRSQVKALIQDTSLDDDGIINEVTKEYSVNLQLEPKATGFDALAWALPVFAGVCAVAGLGFAFWRWRLAADTKPSDEDRELVEAALRDGDDD
jgi:cytochrome c-type biogenesis protein CcmH